LNIYFCERLFGKVLLIEKICTRKSAAGKVWLKNCDRKSAEKKVRQKNRGRKIVVEKSWQKKCGRKIAATTWLGSIYERYDTSCLRYMLGTWLRQVVDELAHT
jgi:hypothetical protein